MREILALSLTVLVFGGATVAEEPFDYFRNNWNVVGLNAVESKEAMGFPHGSGSV